MIKKIAVVDANPWENFLPEFSRANARKYYEWLHHEAHLRGVNHNCRERTEIYGSTLQQNPAKWFHPHGEDLQLLYVQGKPREVLPGLLKEADLVVVGMPRCRKDCDQIYLSVLPWIEQILLFWDGRISREKEFLKRIKNEYKLNEKQIVEFKKLPF